MLFYIRKILSYISIFFFRGVLSDRDIKKLLGKHIFIYPFDEKNLKASSYNLTASQCAFIKEDGDIQELIIRDDKIVIPSHKTAIIYTRESIYVSKLITGTYHSRVNLVNKGLGHIGTTLDPTYWGVSAIALHNTTEKPISLNIGEPIVTIMFYTVRSKSTGLNDNMGGHVNNGIQLECDRFYNFPQDKRNVITVIKNKIDKEKIDEEFIREKIKVIAENEDIKDKSIIIYDVNNPVCKNCINCNEKSECSYKLLKTIYDDNYNKEKIKKEIREWKNQDYIVNKESLIKAVEKEVKSRDNNKDIVIWSVIWIVIGLVIISSTFSYAKDPNLTQLQKDILKTIATVTIPTISLIIGMIVNYKKKYKGE